ncbi:MAG TPA: D-2-hydroxyacid dehydrogenase [Steroidobacteraceae bacterium]
MAFLAGGLIALSQLPAARADDAGSVAAVITRLRVQEAPRPIRERKQWRTPKKVVLLAFGNPTGWAGREEKFAAVAPKAQVVVARDLPSALSATADADAIVGFNPEICNPKIIENAKELRWISSLAAGVELCMAVPSVRGRDLLMTNMRGVDSAAIAEHAVAMAMALAHGLDTFAVDTSKGIWSREHGATTPMQSLEGKTMLVVGLGGIGTEVAMKAHGLGMKIVATRDKERNKPDFVSYVGLANEMLTLAKTADVIVNCVPLTPQTTGIYNAAFFAALKPTAYFINVARGASAVTADLTNALNEHRLAGAGLDVVDPEPLPPDNPLWQAPHVIISPHISSRSDLPGEARWILAVENLRRYANGEKMLSVVNLDKGY